jgi:hypothetical protein
VHVVASASSSAKCTKTTRVKRTLFRLQVTEDSFQGILDLSSSSSYNPLMHNGIVGSNGSNGGSVSDHERFLALSRAFKLDTTSLLLQHPDEQPSPSLISNSFATSPLHTLPHPRNKTCLLSQQATSPFSSEPLFPTLSSTSAEHPLFHQLNSIGSGRPLQIKPPPLSLTGHLGLVSSSSTPSPDSSSSSSAASTSPTSAAAASSSSKVNTSRYKTELCRPYQENGSCKYGEKCQFAHGHHELRSVSRHPKYKSDLCRTYHSVGFCPYGPRCHFIHNLEELKQQQAQQNKGANSSSSSASSSSTANAANGMPPLPMFSSNSPSANNLLLLHHQQQQQLQQQQQQQPQFSAQVNRVRSSSRTRNLSESGYTSSGGGSSSSGQSPNSFMEMDSDSDSAGLTAAALLAAHNAAMAGGRLPVFSTLATK